MKVDHVQLLAWWRDDICGKRRAPVSFFGRTPTIAEPAVAAARVLEAALLDSGYVPTPGSPIGSYACRYIGGGPVLFTDDGDPILRNPDTGRAISLHAVPIALDVEYDLNPYIRTGPNPEPGFGVDSRFKLTEANVNAAEALRNEYGEQLWVWLGWTLGDTMHFQLNVPPDRCTPRLEEAPPMELPLNRWAHMHRPEDVDRLAELGVITDEERLYWRDLDRTSDEWQDFRDAVTVRLEYWKR